MYRPLVVTVGVRLASLHLASATIAGIRSIVGDTRYALHLLYPHPDPELAADILRSHDVPATADTDPNLPFYNTPGAPVAVRRHLIQADVRVDPRAVCYRGDWEEFLRGIEAAGAEAVGAGDAVRPVPLHLRYDHLIHHRHGYQDGLLQQPVPGAVEGLRRLLDSGLYAISIGTQRTHTPAITAWLWNLGLPAEDDLEPNRVTWEGRGRLLVTRNVLQTSVNGETAAYVPPADDSWGAIHGHLAEAYDTLKCRLAAS